MLYIFTRHTACVATAQPFATVPCEHNTRNPFSQQAVSLHNFSSALNNLAQTHEMCLMLQVRHYRTVQRLLSNFCSFCSSTKFDARVFNPRAPRGWVSVVYFQLEAGRSFMLVVAAQRAFASSLLELPVEGWVLRRGCRNGLA